MKKIISIVSIVTLSLMTLLNHSISLKAEESTTGCTTGCTIGEADEQILEKALSYTDEEQMLVMDSVENSDIYKEHFDLVKDSERINVFRNNTDQSYFSVAYIQKDNNNDIISSLIFDVNEKYEVSGAFVTINTGDNIVIEDYMNDTAQVYTSTRTSDCYTLQCTKKTYHGTIPGSKACEAVIGLACSAVMSFSGVIISSMVCYVGKVAICAKAPAGYVCEKWTRYEVCPF